MFRLTMFPAADGDCLLLDYGSEETQHHILVDGGRAATYQTLRPHLEAIGARGECIDLLVLTHMDADHIEGLLPLIKDRQLPVDVRAVWYNGFDQLSGLELYGPAQADVFSAELSKLTWPWNEDFGGGAACVVDGGPIELVGPGGILLTLLTPTRHALALLRVKWLEFREKGAGAQTAVAIPPGLEILGAKLSPTPENMSALATMPSPEDRTVPNGSSIAFIAEYDGRRLLLAADAHPSDLGTMLRRINAVSRRKIHLAKLSHHGSKANTSSRLVGEMQASRFAISTDGSRHGHPDPETIARLLHHGPNGIELYFNYRSEFTEPWSSKGMKELYGHACTYGSGDGLLRIDV